MKISESNEYLRMSSHVGKLYHEMQKKAIDSSKFEGARFAPLKKPVQDEHSLISL